MFNIQKWKDWYYGKNITPKPKIEEVVIIEEVKELEEVKEEPIKEPVKEELVKEPVKEEPKPKI